MCIASVQCNCQVFRNCLYINVFFAYSEPAVFSLLCQISVVGMNSSLKQCIVLCRFWSHFAGDRSITVGVSIL